MRVGLQLSEGSISQLFDFGRQRMVADPEVGRCVVNHKMVERPAS